MLLPWLLRCIDTVMALCHSPTWCAGTGGCRPIQWQGLPLRQAGGHLLYSLIAVKCPRSARIKDLQQHLHLDEGGPEVNPTVGFLL